MMRKLRPTRGRNLDGYCTKTGTLRCERASNFHGGRRQPARHEAGGGRLDGDPDDRPLHLCLDKGYDDPAVHELVADRGYTAHIARRGTERPKTQVPGYRARCWVVERTHAWLNRFRHLRSRWEKKQANYLALLHQACAWITFRAAGVFGY